MATQATIVGGNWHYTGTLSAARMNLPASCVTDATVAADAAISASKLQHQHQPGDSQSGTATAVTKVLHVVQGATAVLEAFSAGSIAKAVGAAVVTVDLLKNGVSVLDDPIELDNTATNRLPVEGVLITTAAVEGDVFEVVVTAVAGGGTLPTGLFWTSKFRELADAA